MCRLPVRSGKGMNHQDMSTRCQKHCDQNRLKSKTMSNIYLKATIKKN